MNPNIVLINCDDLGYGDLGCYGSAKNSTPHLDRLASQGMRFTDFYMASALCSPSRGAMMTGCYPPRIGFGQFENQGVLFPGQGVGLNPDERTIARQLKEAGYATAHVGKWHCGDQPAFLPTNHGFDHYFGIPYSNDMGRQVGRENGPPLPLLNDLDVLQQQPDQRTLTERYTVECTRFIRENRDRPFFLYLGHMYVHVPLFVPKQFLERSRNGAYGGAVECIDWSTGVIMDTLKQLGLEENTLVIFTSDNGSRAANEGGSNDPCRGNKGTTWEGGSRVPCIMRWPQRIAAGTTCSHVARSIDFFPTLAALANTTPKRPDTHPIDGVDISSLMFQANTSPPNETHYYYSRNALDAIRVGDWKLHFRKGGKPLDALYNLRQDVGETTDLYAAEPQVVARLTAAADIIRQDLGDAALNIPGPRCRPIGRVDNPKPLTEYRPDHPYMIAMYDLPDMPTMAG